MRPSPPVRRLPEVCPEGPGPIPALAGVGAKPAHYLELKARAGEGGSDTSGAANWPISWIEVHAENFMGPGGRTHRALDELREVYPLSLHGVGLSLGSAGPLDKEHLGRLKHLVKRFKPALVSEHLAWSRFGGTCFNDLLPVPCTFESLRTFCDHVDETQDALGCAILIENPSAYLQPTGAQMSETDFLVETTRRTGCKLLLDVNNVYVSSQNLGCDPQSFIDDLPVDLIEEVHLAGYSVDTNTGTRLLVDTHGARVSDPVWALYERLIDRTGPLPTLIEWDTDVPTLDVLADEAARADRIMERSWTTEVRNAAL